MDFAKLMSAQISKSKPTQSATAATEQKFFKRSDLESARQSAYAAEQAAIEVAREERAAKKRKLEEEEAERLRTREEKKRRLAEESKARREEEEMEQERKRRKRLGLPDLEEKAKNGEEGTPLQEDEDIPEDVLIAKLRKLSEPARLFGESHKGRLRRYSKLVKRAETSQQQLSDGPIPTTLELVPEAEMKIPEKLPGKSTPERAYLFRQLASYFNMVLREWEVALARRDQEVIESFQGKAAAGAMVQSRDNLRPLFKKFELGDVEDGILEPVLDIVRCAQARRYVDANDGYLRLSIGKA